MKKAGSKSQTDGRFLHSVLSDLTYAVAIERLGRWVSRRIVWRGPGQQARIALTFDDGPQPTYTSQLLEILHKHKAKATFFLIGKHLEQHYALAERIVADGHEVANHTFTHPLLLHLSEEEIVVEINKTDQFLRKLNGSRANFFRPPMGLFNRRVLDIIEHTGYRTVIGDVYPRDPYLPGKNRIVRRVLQRVRNGSIIILHDGGNTENVDRRQTIEAVDEFIPILQQRGFEFCNVSELLSD